MNAILAMQKLASSADPTQPEASTQSVCCNGSTQSGAYCCNTLQA